MMIGTLPSWRRMRQTSRPFSSGSMRSSRIRSGRELRALATPSAPSWATVTAYPSFLRLKVSMSRMVASSSTTRMRLGTLTQLHDPPGMKEDHVFGDVGHAVGDPLQVLGKKEQDGCTLYVGRVLDHEFDELVPDLVIKGVNLIVAFGDRPSLVLISLDHGTQDLVHLRFGDLGHPGQVDIGFELGQVVEAERSPRNADRVVAHTLQLQHHVLEADDEPQVTGHRLLRRHDHESPLAQLAMQLVDLLVTRDDFLGECVVAIDQGAHGFGERLLDHAAYANDA